MDLASIRLLLTPAGQEALREAEALQPQESGFLQHFTRLSRRFPPELARPALEIAILRREAKEKFPFAGQMYFTRPALEQASAFEISAYRAQRFAPFRRLADLGCSIGGDTQALARLAPTLAVDRDAVRLAMARANLANLGLGERATFVQSDLLMPLPVQPDADTALFFDPARRTEGRRIFSVADYQPPLSSLLEWRAHFPALGVKISPGVDVQELQPYEAEVEFISLRGELKEATLWFGPLQTTRRRATLLPGGHTLESGLGWEAMAGHRLPLSEPQAYLYEPDPAVLRAGLVADLGHRLGASQLDPDIAYLTTASAVPTPFARGWQVEAWFPFSLKRLRQALRQRGVGQVTVKKRGSPLQPEALIRDLKLKGDQQRVVFLTHLQGRPICILCFPEEVCAN